MLRSGVRMLPIPNPATDAIAPATKATIATVILCSASMAHRIALVLLIALSACSKREPAANEHTYPMTATIVARDAAQNAVTLDNKAVPGVMDAMRMDYRVGDAKVNALPPNGTLVNATLHERDGDYWV